jgi:hypothetical protein
VLSGTTVTHRTPRKYSARVISCRSWPLRSWPLQSRAFDAGVAPRTFADSITAGADRANGSATNDPRQRSCVGSNKREGVSNESEGGKLQDLMFHRIGNSRLLTLSLYPWIPSNFRHSLNRRTSGAFIPPVWIKHTGILATPKSTRMYVRSVTFSLNNSSPQA